MVEKRREREPFLPLVPRGGWLSQYIEWTMGSEAPAPYHFFVGCCVLGVSLGRNVWFDKGYYRLYPNLQVLLVGPTGRVRKTSAINLGVKLLTTLGDINVVSEKITPEALVDAFSTGAAAEEAARQGRIRLEPSDAIGLISAPELAVFLGKQKYNEGIIALLTTLFDSPDQWSYSTKKGKIDLHNVAITMLGASTPDWLVSAIPQDAFGGGFMSRLLFVVQEETDRCYPIPEPPSSPDVLVQGLRSIRLRKGPLVLSDTALAWYVKWYAASRKDIPEDEKMAGYHERKPDHMIRLGMVMALAEASPNISEEHLVRASRVLAFLEHEMLYTFKWLGMKPIGQDQERIVRTLKSAGGTMPHAELLRKLIFFMNAIQFRNAVQTLQESGLVRVHLTNQEHWYELLREE